MKKVSATWLMLLYNLPAQSSTQRVFVWRKLKNIGVLYWQNAVCLLPERPGLRAKFEELRQDIEHRGGNATLSTIQFPDPQEHAGIVSRFQQQADEEYQEFLGQCHDFHAELEKERKDSHFTFAELEENEVELDKLRSWLPKIRERDYFNAPLAPKADTALAACEKDFAKYTAQVAKANERDFQEQAATRPTRTQRR
jgi:hypothetical protein